MEKTKFTHRLIARIVIEAVTPLSVGSGEDDITTDALVAIDANGLPYIPGTSIAGILRHAIGEDQAEKFFGKNGSYSTQDNGRGSEIIFTEARMLGPDGNVIDGLQTIDFEDDFFKHFKNLPIRQHVRIDHRGTSESGGKFDQQVVYKGTRFCFEIEMVATNNDTQQFDKVLSHIHSDAFYLGSNTRSGLGKMRVVNCETKRLDLSNQTDLEFYIEKSSRLDTNSWHGNTFVAEELSNWTKIELQLQPQDFFLIGTGIGDDDVDITPVKESYLSYEKGAFIDCCTLIPGSSIKGALSHRTAFHYNRLKKLFADNISSPNDPGLPVGKNNLAVRALFGSEGIEVNKKMKYQLRGNVLIGDILKEDVQPNKTFNHVAINRFTGGAIDGALFSEKVIGKNNEDSYHTTIFINKEGVQDTAQDETEIVMKAFYAALDDLCNGMLPLGGGVNRGHGTFFGFYKGGNE